MLRIGVVFMMTGRRRFPSCIRMRLRLFPVTGIMVMVTMLMKIMDVGMSSRCYLYLFSVRLNRGWRSCLVNALQCCAVLVIWWSRICLGKMWRQLGQVDLDLKQQWLCSSGHLGAAKWAFPRHSRLTTVFPETALPSSLLISLFWCMLNTFIWSLTNINSCNWKGYAILFNQLKIISKDVCYYPQKLVHVCKHLHLRVCVCVYVLHVWLLTEQLQMFFW